MLDLAVMFWLTFDVNSINSFRDFLQRCATDLNPCETAARGVEPCDLKWLLFRTSLCVSFVALTFQNEAITDHDDINL